MSFSRKIDRFPYIISVFFVIATCCVVFSEYFILPREQYLLYASVRLLLTLSTVPLVLRFKNMTAGDSEIAYFFTVSWLSCFWASWFLAGYEIGYAQCAVASAFVMTRRKWIYPAVFGTGALAMFLGFFLRDFYGVTVHPLRSLDWMMILAIFFAIGTIVNAFFFRDRVFREQALFRFSTLGQQAFQIAHDLKGLMASPMLQLDHLRENVMASSREDLVRSLEHLTQDLDRMRTMVLQLNRMVLKEEAPVPIDICEIVRRVCTFLGKRLSGIDVRMPEGMPLRGYEGRMQSALFNLMLNSIEAFDGALHPSPTVWIERTKFGFRYRDNAGGAPPSVLLSLKKGAFVSTKGYDRGHGLSFVQQDLGSMGGVVSFRNDANGFVVDVEYKNMI